MYLGNFYYVLVNFFYYVLVIKMEKITQIES